MGFQFLHGHIQHPLLAQNIHLWEIALSDDQIANIGKIDTQKVVFFAQNDLIFLETYVDSVVDRYAQLDQTKGNDCRRDFQGGVDGEMRGLLAMDLLLDYQID